MKMYYLYVGGHFLAAWRQGADSDALTWCNYIADFLNKTSSIHTIMEALYSSSHFHCVLTVGI